MRARMKSLLKTIAAVAFFALASLAPHQAEATISIVQNNQSSATATSTTIALAFTGGVAAGDYIYVALTQITASGTTATCSDNVNGAYPAALDSLAVGSGAAEYQFAFGPSASGTITVTCTFSATSTFRGIFIAEIGGTGGLDTSGTFHSAHLTTSGTAMTSGTLTPSVANGLAIGAFIDGNIASLTTVPGAGFTDLFPTANTFWTFTTGQSHGDAAFQIYSTTANVPVTFTTSIADSLGGVVGALFKPAITATSGPSALARRVFP